MSSGIHSFFYSKVSPYRRWLESTSESTLNRHPLTFTCRRVKGRKKGQGALPLFIRVARTSVGRTFNVKSVLSFTRFKGLVTARNHAVRVYGFLPSGIR